VANNKIHKLKDIEGVLIPKGIKLHFPLRHLKNDTEWFRFCEDENSEYCGMFINEASLIKTDMFELYGEYDVDRIYEYDETYISIDIRNRNGKN
jgi:hypothetical protein